MLALSGDFGKEELIRTNGGANNTPTTLRQDRTALLGLGSLESLESCITNRGLQIDQRVHDSDCLSQYKY